MNKIISFPHLSNYYIPIKYIIEKITKLQVYIPPYNNKQTISLGAKYSPDDICMPFKYNLGNYINALNNGANILVQAGGGWHLSYGCRHPGSSGGLHEGWEIFCGDAQRLSGFQKLSPARLTQETKHRGTSDRRHLRVFLCWDIPNGSPVVVCWYIWLLPILPWAGRGAGSYRRLPVWSRALPHRSPPHIGRHAIWLPSPQHRGMHPWGWGSSLSGTPWVPNRLYGLSIPGRCAGRWRRCVLSCVWRRVARQVPD